MDSAGNIYLYICVCVTIILKEKLVMNLKQGIEGVGWRREGREIIYIFEKKARHSGTCF